MNKRFRNKLPIIAIIAICALYLGLVALNISGVTWFDESYSSYLVRGDFWQIIKSTAYDVHPPLYYLALKVWSLVFGHSMVALRAMSACFGVIVILLAHKLAKRLLKTERLALVATLAVAISPFLVRYGQEMRMYTMVATIVLAATIALQDALKTDDRRYWRHYAILVSLGMWTHYFSAMFWLAQLIYIAIERKKAIFKKPILTTYFLAIGFFLPWLPVAVIQFATVQSGFWIPPVTFATVSNFMLEALLFNGYELPGISQGFEPLHIALALAVLATATLIIAQKFWNGKKHEVKLLIQLLCYILIPAIVLALLSLPPLTPIFYSRYLAYSAILLAPTLAILFMVQRTLPRRVIAMLLLVATLATGVYAVETREPSSDINECLSVLENIDLPAATSDAHTYFNLLAENRSSVVGALDLFDIYFGSDKSIPIIKYALLDNTDILAEKCNTFVYITRADTDRPQLEHYEIKQTIKTTHYNLYQMEVK